MNQSVIEEKIRSWRQWLFSLQHQVCTKAEKKVFPILDWYINKSSVWHQHSSDPAPDIHTVMNGVLLNSFLALLSRQASKTL